MNYEKRKCLFAIHELWKYPFETHEYEKIKILLSIHELWNICLKYMNYEKWNCSQCMNYENIFLQ